MSEELIRELAQQIVSDGLLNNWMFWTLLLAVSFVGAVASAFVTTYIRKRGETYATKADLAELVAQLRTTTQAAEEVRIAIAHADWSSKEWKVLRRVKLEELLDAVHSTQDWLELVCAQRLYKSKGVRLDVFLRNEEMELTPSIPSRL